MGRLHDLLRGTSDEPARLGGRAQIVQRYPEGRISGEALEHVVVRGAILHGAGCRNTVPANQFVRFLSIAASLHEADNQLFGGHERQLVRHAASDARRMHFKAAHNVLHQHEECVGGQERFRNHQTTVG
jgi:hypothetical protein